MSVASGPRGGVDYPRTFNEFERFFDEEAACRAYLMALRWPGGYRCPRCGCLEQPWITQRGYLHCRDCGKEISVMAGTIFERTRTPLRTWFLAIWFITGQKHGASVLGLQRVLGLGSYQTAWTWLHKLRRTMVRPGRNRLCGCVEVDETFVGGSERGSKRGRGAQRKAIVVIATASKGPSAGSATTGRRGHCQGSAGGLPQSNAETVFSRRLWGSDAPFGGHRTDQTLLENWKKRISQLPHAVPHSLVSTNPPLGRFRTSRNPATSHG